MRNQSAPVARRRVRPVTPPARPAQRARAFARAPLKLAGAFLLIAIGSAGAVGEGTIMAGVAAAQESLDALAGRSPGVRTEADMTKGKARAAAPLREARALPRVRDQRGSILAPAGGGALPALAGAAPAVISGPGIVEQDVPGTSGSAFLPGLVGGAPGGGGIFEGPGGGGAIGPGGGGPGGGGGGGGGGGIIVVPGEETPPTLTPPGENPGGPVVNPPVDTAPIPEPATWLSMILGFAAAGIALRRRTALRSSRA